MPAQNHKVRKSVKRESRASILIQSEPEAPAVSLVAGAPARSRRRSNVAPIAQQRPAHSFLRCKRTRRLRCKRGGYEMFGMVCPRLGVAAPIAAPLRHHEHDTAER